MRTTLTNGVVAALLLALVHASSARAYEVSKTSGGKEIKWSSPAATYYINTSGGPSGTLTALKNSLQTWSDVSTSTFAFTYGGSTTSTAFGADDGVNIIGFGAIPSAGVLAQNTFWYDTDTGEISDSDIEFNTTMTWSTSGSSSAYDVQNIGTHEIGHALSLDDLYESGDVEKTMYGYALKGETKKRSLDQDDINGISYLYPVVTPIVGDFDGDGKTDLGYYTAATGTWKLMRSTLGSFTTTFGYTGTVPVVGDFDGDGKSDFGCYYAPLGMWYLFKSTEGFYSTQFGYTGTVPVVGDFDGDGRSDFGCYYAPLGMWYLFRSTEGFYSTQFGYSGTAPLVGDFDNDTQSDFGCYYPTGGNWYLFRSTEGFYSTQFGYAGTVPVVGDFDGDGRSDFGVFDPKTGNWYLFKSTEGFFQTNF